MHEIWLQSFRLLVTVIGLQNYWPDFSHRDALITVASVAGIYSLLHLNNVLQNKTIFNNKEDWIHHQG